MIHRLLLIALIISGIFFKANAQKEITLKGASRQVQETEEEYNES